MKSSKISIIPFVFILLAFNFLSCNGQPLKQEVESDIRNEGSDIQWISFEDAISQSKDDPKKIFIDVYTSWCGWCKRMDQTTFKEETVVDYLNEKYYSVKLNAETRDTIEFRDVKFKYQPQYKANELAVSLLGGKMGYPSYVILDENFNLMTQPVQSYLTKENLMPILVFFGDKIHEDKTWEQFQSEMEGSK